MSLRPLLLLGLWLLAPSLHAAAPEVLFTTSLNLAQRQDTVELEVAAPFSSGATPLEIWSVSPPPARHVATIHIEGTDTDGSVFRRQSTRLDPTLHGPQRFEVRLTAPTSSVAPVSGTPAPIRVRALTTAALGPLDPFVKTDGIYLKNHWGHGDIVRLRGVNLGGWLLQESFMSPLQGGWDEYRARATLTSRFGAARAEKLIATFQDAWITEADFARMAAAGLNCVRLPIHWQNHLREDGTFKRLADGSIDFARLDWVVRTAKRHGLYTLLDLHGAPGSQNGRDHAGDQRGPLLWDSKHYRDLTKSLWRELARHYRDEPAVIGYDLLNEPARTNKAKQWDQTIIDFTSELYAEIRAIDPDHVIFFSVWSEYNHVGNLPVGKTNFVLAYHWYVYRTFLEKEGTESDFWIQRITRNGGLSRDRHDAPCFLGEFSFKDDPALWSDRLAFLTRQGLGWAKWSYKTRAGTGWGLYEANGKNDRNIPDLAKDDYETIRRKWASWTTEATFTLNPAVAASFTRAASLTADAPPLFPHATSPQTHRPARGPRRLF